MKERLDELLDEDMQNRIPSKEYDITPTHRTIMGLSMFLNVPVVDAGVAVNMSTVENCRVNVDFFADCTLKLTIEEFFQNVS